MRDGPCRHRGFLHQRASGERKRADGICIARQCGFGRDCSITLAPARPRPLRTQMPLTPPEAAPQSSSRWAEASDCPIAFSIRCRSAGSGAASRQSKNTRVTRRGSIRVAITDMTAASMDHRRVTEETTAKALKHLNAGRLPHNLHRRGAHPSAPGRLLRQSLSSRLSAGPVFPGWPPRPHSPTSFHISAAIPGAGAPGPLPRPYLASRDRLAHQCATQPAP